ncbi:MAG: SirB1 family protein, partial [Myxococcaceae bacterium]
EKYHAPENSFLNRILERKLGLPIGLGVLYLEVARRAGIPLFGVNFPGHFLIAGHGTNGILIVDPFHKGSVLTEDGCVDLLKEMAPQMVFKPEMISPAPLATVLSRMLNNLKRVYLETCDHARALRVVSLLLRLHPDHPGELRVRASVLCSLGAFKAALKDVRRCLELSPSAPDREGLEMAEKALKERVDQLN